ncbi:hypothetical protein [Arthrobacter sp. H20]|uniref:hypothetical protein n=1 Tax=Arthrobacter sp. H20 TaxID=1267981 RepID=UPI0004B5F5AE|nr:hypothetical protein [Arthrobacter sp. H20]
MLRVRLTLFTADPAQAAALLQALGLISGEATADQRLFDASGGRIAVHKAGAGTHGLVILGFEAGVLDEFARRTRESGTAAEVVSGPDGEPTARVTMPGLTFTVDRGERELSTGVHPHLTVVCVWHTPATTSAARALRDIGARPRTGETSGPLDFAAKNGGLVSVRPAEQQRFELGFEYAGALSELLSRVQNAGFPAELVDIGADRFLRVPLPTGRYLIIAVRREEPGP